MLHSIKYLVTQYSEFGFSTFCEEFFYLAAVLLISSKHLDTLNDVIVLWYWMGLAALLTLNRLLYVLILTFFRFYCKLVLSVNGRIFPVCSSIFMFLSLKFSDWVVIFIIWELPSVNYRMTGAITHTVSET